MTAQGGLGGTERHDRCPFPHIAAWAVLDGEPLNSVCGSSHGILEPNSPTLSIRPQGTISVDMQTAGTGTSSGTGDYVLSATVGNAYRAELVDVFADETTI